MPKVRQRDPNDKVKTKGKKHSKNRKKQTNVPRQMQAAVEQKVKQKQEQQASNEAATTTTEQAVVETIAGAAQLAGKTSGVIYDKVIRQQIPEEGAVHRAESAPEPQQPEIPQMQRSQYTEQGRRLAVQEYADSHYRSSIPSIPVSEPFQENKGINTGVQPKQKPLSNTTPQNLPKSQEHPKATHNSGAVEMGRKVAIQTHIKAQIEKKDIQQSASITADTPVLQNTITPRQSGVAPKTRTVPELNQGNGPKTKDAVSPLTDVPPVEQGRRQAIRSHTASIGERKQMKAGTAQVQDVPLPSSEVKLSDTNIQPKTRPDELSDSKLMPKTKDAPIQPVTDAAVEQGRRLVVQKYAETQAEKAMLHPKRFRESASVAKTSSDNRSPFKKDFDTVCNSTILRRLQDKAQVFPLEQEDYARTRLTHSIEVMSVASSLAVQAIKVILETNLDQYLSSDYKLSHEISDFRETIKEIPTILNAAALLHDMGNPPFGHLGEQIISDWFRNNLPKIVKKADGTYVFNDVGSADDTLAYKLKGKYAEDLMHFEGNAQLLRLVTKLSYVVDEHGMNLSYPVLASFIKYPCASTNIDKSKLSTKKMGYFTTEEDEFTAICEALGLHNCRHPLAFLLEAADDIACNRSNFWYDRFACYDCISNRNSNINKPTKSNAKIWT